MGDDWWMQLKSLNTFLFVITIVPPSGEHLLQRIHMQRSYTRSSYMGSKDVSERETVYVNDCKRQSGRYDISESLCLLNISVLGGLPYYRLLGNDRFVTFTSREVAA